MENSQVLSILKVAVMLIFFGIVTVFGTLPIRSRRFQQRPLLRALGSTFAGCLFLNVSIMHILPEASDTLQDYLRGDEEDKEVFPLANLLMILGFTITIFFTRVLTFHTHEDDHKHTHQKQELTEEKDPQKIQQQLIEKNQGEKNKSINNEAYILTLAMYFHTVFEGIAIGVQNKIPGFLSTAVAIGLHKWADALSMGCHYKNKGINKKISYILIIGQAVLNILSIGLGWIISEGGDVTEAIFLSISAGTFLAISTIQILGEQLHHKQYMKEKFCLLIAATGLISAVWAFQNSIFEPVDS